MMSEAETHRLIAGTVCLDFANTVNGHVRVKPHEYLKNYRDLVLWSRHAAILSAPEADHLVRAGKRRRIQQARAYARAIRLRETIYRIFTASVHGSRPLADDLQALNAARSHALAHSRIAPAQGGYIWEWTDNTAFERPLWPIAISAAELLTSGDIGRVRACAGDRCDWLFVDNSRNHLRRWCSMDECGNRAKGKRFHARNRPPAARAVLHRHSVTSAHV